MPTYDCNFRCPYCFEQHRLKRGEGWLASTMEDETMDAVFFAFVASHMAGSNWEKNHDEEMSLSLAGPLSRLTAAERETIMTTKSHKEILGIVQALGLFPGGEEKRKR